jgi:hypothetical protein
MPNIKSILKIGFPFISAGLSAAGPLGAMAGTRLGQCLECRSLIHRPMNLSQPFPRFRPISSLA